MKIKLILVDLSVKLHAGKKNMHNSVSNSMSDLDWLISNDFCYPFSVRLLWHKLKDEVQGERGPW